jgi:hypothetical protein
MLKELSVYYSAVSHFCRKENKVSGIAVYSSKDILQYKHLKWITEKTLEVTGIELIDARGEKKLLHYMDHVAV